MSLLPAQRASVCLTAPYQIAVDMVVDATMLLPPLIADAASHYFAIAAAATIRLPSLPFHATYHTRH